MKTKHTNVSNNTLLETANLLAALSNLIERDYLHVAENISSSIKKSIDLEMDKVQKEIEKRENY
jgi:hypothetical protein